MVAAGCLAARYFGQSSAVYTHTHTEVYQLFCWCISVSQLCCPQCSNNRGYGGFPPTAVVDSSVIHGVEVSALQCRPPPLPLLFS